MKEVTAAIITKDNKVLICQRGKTDKLSGKWEFPGGKIEPGETPEECLKREIKEELGIDIDVKNRFGESIYDYSSGAIKLIAFYAEWKSGEIKLYVHDAYKLEPTSKLAEYDFAPADIPFVNDLMKLQL